MLSTPVKFWNRLWIGNIYAARNSAFLIRHHITGVLTCGSLAVPWCTSNPSSDDMRKGNPAEKGSPACPNVSHSDLLKLEDSNASFSITHRRLDWEDCNEGELELHLKEATQFILDQLAFSDGDILIHCWAGQCRSATAAVAYITAVANVSVHHAYREILCSKYPTACISSYFLAQLYQFQKNQQAASLTESLTLTPKEDDGNSTPVKRPAPTDASHVYSCKLCRCVLFYDTDIIPCEPTAKAKKQRFGKKRFGEEPKDECTSFFIQDLDWISPDGLQLGKLLCCNVDCKTKLGGYSFYGLRCSCGAWQTPAFQINKTRVDVFPLSHYVAMT